VGGGGLPGIPLVGGRHAHQGYTAGRNYMCLAVTICAWPQLFVPGRNYLFFSEIFEKKIHFRANFNV
jgi:hypothetical protein